MPDKPRSLGVDQPRIERAVREILLAVGENPDREGLAQTPARVARSYAELLSGLNENPRTHLRTVFTERYDEIVLLRDVEGLSSQEACDVLGLRPGNQRILLHRGRANLRQALATEMKKA